jgi:ribosomal protein S19E (S16A)
MGVTVKDVPAKEFIEAFAKHLKKGNKIKMPEVSYRPCDSPRWLKN